MRYIEFKDMIQNELQQNPRGLSWVELRNRLGLPYTIPCPEWVKRMEREIGLTRTKGPGHAFIWKIQKRKYLQK